MHSSCARSKLSVATGLSSGMVRATPVLYESQRAKWFFSGPPMPQILWPRRSLISMR